MGKPFFRAQTQSWYYKDGNKFVPLGKDKAEAEREWHRRMAGQAEVTPTTTVGVILDKFLAWCGKNKAPATKDWYANYLESLREFQPAGLADKIGALPWSNLKPYHVDQWISDHCTGLGNNSKNAAARCALRVFNWALKFGYVTCNPIVGIEVAPKRRREVCLTPKQWNKILDSVKVDDPFRDVLLTLRNSGCRPQEVRLVEARHFDPDARAWVFPVDESKAGDKTGRNRVVPLNKTALAITRRLALKYPEGPLFRNTDGTPWTRHSFNCRCKRLTEKLGFKFCLYLVRHLYVTESLLRGIDPTTLSIITGHSPETMLRVYQHVNQRPEHVRKAVENAVPEHPPKSNSATA
jgi:integrase